MLMKGILIVGDTDSPEWTEVLSMNQETKMMSLFDAFLTRFYFHFHFFYLDLVFMIFSCLIIAKQCSQYLARESYTISGRQMKR